MSRWKARDPSIYPIRYSDVVEKSLATDKPVLLGMARDSYMARCVLDHFREWRFCLRKSPGRHRCSSIELSHRITTKTTFEFGSYHLYVIVKPRPSSSILSLNPELADLSI